MLQLRKSAASHSRWDKFAQRCGASFRSSYRGTIAWQFEFHWFHRQRRFDLHLVTATSAKKIGQCAVGVGRRKSIFCDGLQLLPAHQKLWNVAMTAVLEHLGPAEYVYGSEWSFEPPREVMLGEMRNVTVTSVQPTSIAVIDFQSYGSWEQYLRAVSTNVRRNIRKAQKASPPPVIFEAAGWTKYRHYLRSFGLRRAMFRRKKVRKSSVSMLARSVARLLSMNRYSQIAYLMVDRILTAYYVGIRYGRNYYYLEGASRPGGNGTSWLLLMTMIERAYHRSSGRGKFVMGSDDGTQAGIEAWQGLQRSRRQCRAEPFPTSVVHFSYAGPPAA